MKKVFIIVFLTALVISSCKKRESVSVIPANASMVVSLDMLKFSTESDLIDSKLFEQACRVLKINPLDMGIDFTEPLYIFQLGNDYVCITASVGDEDNMTDCLSQYAKEKIAVKPKKSGELTWSKLFGEVDLAYNDETLLLVYRTGDTGINAKQMIRSLFELKEEESFYATEHFSRMNDITSSDIVVYSNLSAMSENVQNIVSNFLPENVGKDAVKMISTLDSEDGALVISSKIYSDKDNVQKVLDEQSQSLTKLEGDYLSKVPERSFVTLMAGIKGDKLHKFVNSIPQLSTQLTVASFAIDYDLDELINSTEGDIMICYDDNGDMMWNINGEQNTHLPNATVNWDGPCKELDITTRDISKCCIYGYVDLSQTDMKQYTRLISLPSIYKCVNSLTDIRFYSEGLGDITIRIESSNNENIFKQLLK